MSELKSDANIELVVERTVTKECQCVILASLKFTHRTYKF